MKWWLNVGGLVLTVGSLYGQVSAQEYLRFLSTQDLQTVVRDGSLVVFGDKLKDLRLWKHSPFADTVQTADRGIDTSLVAECLFLVDRPATKDDHELAVKIFKSFTAFTNLKGLQVYSSSQHKMETFIFESYRVDGLQNPKPLPNPDPADLSQGGHYRIYQKEEQTGDMYNDFTFTSHGSWYEVTISNLANINFGVFTLVGVGKLRTAYYVVPTKDKLVVYGINMADTLRFLGLETTKRDSFSNRMKALETWFAANLKNQ